MKLVLILVLTHLFFSQNGRIPKIYQERMINSSDIRFIGIDPNDSKIPKFDFTAYQEIDTNSHSYTLNVESEIKYYYLSAKREGAYTFFNYELRCRVYNANEDSSKNEKYKNIKFEYDGSDLKSDLFKTNRNTFKFRALPPALYKVEIMIKDLTSGMTYKISKELEIRDAKNEEILITDPVFYDSHTGKQLISKNNAFLNRSDSIKIRFKTFAKNTEESYLLLLRIYRRINSNRFPARVLIELEKDFYHFTKRWSVFELTIPKSNFDHYEVNLGLKNQIMQKVDITAKKYVSTVTKTELSENIVSADSLQDVDFSKDRFSSNITDVSLENLDYYSEALFTFSWDTIPNTAYEMKQFSRKLKIVFPDHVYSEFDDADFKTKRQIFRDFWKSKSISGDYNEGLAAFYLFKDKVDFAINNFFELRNSLGIVAKDPFFNDGWRSGKGILYLKHGLPDEITGENFIDEDGSLKFLMELPVQRWLYYDKNRAYVFLGNKEL